MTKHYPKTLMTLALSAMIATTGISSANANVGAQKSEITASQEQVLSKELSTPLNPGVTIPLIKQTSIIDRLASVKTQLAVIADPSVKLSFERPAIKTIPAPPSPAEIAQKKAEEEARVAEEKAVKVAEEAKVVAEKEAAEAAANPAPAVPAPAASTQKNQAPAAQQAAPAAPVAAPQNLGSLQQYAVQAMNSRGMNGASEITCLIPLWNHESGWNPNAANPTSTARGIPQMMMNIHYGANWQTSAAGVAYLTNPQVQIDKGLDYIAGRYGTPCNAWGTWQSQRWY